MNDQLPQVSYLMDSEVAFCHDLLRFLAVVGAQFLAHGQIYCVYFLNNIHYLSCGAILRALLFIDIFHIPFTIGLSASITFKVVSESKYNFKLWKYDYFSTFQWRPHLIWSSNPKEIWIFVKQVTSPFVPSFAIRMYVAFTDTLPSQHTDLQTFQILCIPFQQRQPIWQPKRLADM